MSSTLIQRSTDQKSVERLDQVYDAQLIAKEKKPFLIDLRKSVGPYLAVADSDEFILDGCSQIASLGLGFNASPMFAPAHHFEAWTGDYTTENIRQYADAYRHLLKRMLGDFGEDYHVQFCSSGAEAIETSLGISFENRTNRSANRVLAFKGSFHGRMMVALSATWNIKKRKPFIWPGYLSE
ncbi:MAG: aminotransferase class III-fold pyridoxal phosphate-dependent enzyme, partial [Planctomycetota bacterium]